MKAALSLMLLLGLLNSAVADETPHAKRILEAFSELDLSREADTKRRQLEIEPTPRPNLTQRLSNEMRSDAQEKLQARKEAFNEQRRLKAVKPITVRIANKGSGKKSAKSVKKVERTVAVMVRAGQKIKKSELLAIAHQQNSINP